MQQINEAVVNMEVQTIEADNFGWIVQQHQKRIFRILMFLVKDEDTAENLTQECFLRAFRNRDSFRGESSLATWLLRIALNLAYDYRKSRRWIFWRSVTQTDQIESIPVRDTCPTPERVLLDKELLETVQAAVDRLPERQRTVFLLRYLEDMSLDEIAGVLRLPVGTVKSHLFRAVRSIRRVCGK
jgi:RNA polymerase sigma-70 factor (ECF subfamily)